MLAPRPRRFPALLAALAAVAGLSGRAAAETAPAPPPSPGSQPVAKASSTPTTAGAPAPTSQETGPAPGRDPFARLRVVVPRDRLGPISSIRVRDQVEEADRSRAGTITISIGSRPSGATVRYGGKVLGSTPLTLTAKQGSTPYDIVLHKGGYMTLRTRIRRTTDRDESGKRKQGISYFYTLSPAKIR